MWSTWHEKGKGKRLKKKDAKEMATIIASTAFFSAHLFSLITLWLPMTYFLINDNENNNRGKCISMNKCIIIYECMLWGGLNVDYYFLLTSAERKMDLSEMLEKSDIILKK